MLKGKGVAVELWDLQASFADAISGRALQRASWLAKL